MLPIPSKNFIPKIFHNDSRIDNLSNKIDSHLKEWGKETKDLSRLIRPDECNENLLDELGYWINAGIKTGDSETIKRKKIQNAVSSHKARGTWNYDVKKRIDNITGLTPGSRILRFDFFGTDEWILCGDGLTPSSYYWASMGSDGIDSDLGIALIGDGTEIEIAGNIYIDCHEGINTAVLNAETILKIVFEIETDVVPAYMRVFLGYIDVSGSFQIYTIIL